jgi:hypothetical protein
MRPRCGLRITAGTEQTGRFSTRREGGGATGHTGNLGGRTGDARFEGGQSSKAKAGETLVTLPASRA